VHLRHCIDETLALRFAERHEDRLGHVVGSAVHLLDLVESCPCEVRRSHPVVSRTGAQLDEAGDRELLHDPTEISGIETKAGSEISEIRATRPDLEQDPRLSEWAIAAEEVVVQRACALGDEAVKAPDVGYMLGLHCLTLVRQCWLRQGSPIAYVIVSLDGRLAASPGGERRLCAH
jgi:hypothetical protein